MTCTNAEVIGKIQTSWNISGVGVNVAYFWSVWHWTFPSKTPEIALTFDAIEFKLTMKAESIIFGL